MDLLQASVDEVVNFLSQSFAKVTCYLRTLFPLEQPNLVTLTMKTVLLCALSSAQGNQTLCALDLIFKKQSQDCLSFVIAEHLKTSKSGK